MAGGLPANPARSRGRYTTTATSTIRNYLRYLVTQTAPGRIHLGTDYPFALMQSDPFNYLSRAGLSEADLEMACFGAARDFLNIQAT